MEHGRARLGRREAAALAAEVALAAAASPAGGGGSGGGGGASGGGEMLNTLDKDRIAQAVEKAEATTSGEIICALANEVST